MQRLHLLLALALGTFIVVIACVAYPAAADDLAKETPRVLRHVVMFKFKETSSKADIQSVADAFAQLPKKIDAIKDFEWGVNNSPEGLNQDFTHVFLVTFADEEGRSTYLPHPDHKAFVEILKPHMAGVCVVDYWSAPEKESALQD